MDGYGSDDIAADKSRNYTSFGLESIKLFASTVHSPNAIEAKVLAQLSEDTSYRLRELIASSFQYTRHSKRFKLTCDDVNRALKASDSQAIYGFSVSDSSKEIHVPEAGVFVTEDKPVDLVKSSESIINKSYKVNLIAESPQYRIDWLNPGSRTIKELAQPGPDEKPSQEYLQLMKIFNCISKGITSRNIAVFQKTLVGLSKHSNVQHILSYLVKFIANNVAKTANGKTARQLLLSIRALSKNNYLQVTSDIYVTPLVKSVLHCILRGSSDHPHTSSSSSSASATSTLASVLTSSSVPPTPTLNGTIEDNNNCSDSSDTWSLKSFAASILVDMFKEWSSSFVHNKFYNHIIRALISCIRDPSQSYASHYGAIVAFTRLGFDCIINHLYPFIGSYLNELFICQNKNLILTSHDAIGAQQIIGAWLNLAIYLLRKFREMALVENNFQFQHIVGELIDHFGDSLAIQLPADFPDPEKIYIKRPPQPIKVPIVTGEELLDTFYDNNIGGRGGENLSEDDDSIDGKSNESEKDCKRHDGADLLVQSTISDPSLGVKLTIKKIRRQRRSVDEQYPSNGKSGRKWKKPKLQNFMEGFTEECEDLLLEEVQTKGNLYSHRMVKKSLSLPYQPTSWYLLANKLPSLAKKRKSNGTTYDHHWRRKLFSCTLNTTL